LGDEIGARYAVAIQKNNQLTLGCGKYKFNKLDFGNIGGIPRLLEALRALSPASVAPDPDFPFLLSAGQRRLQNANQNFRDPGFRKDDPDGALSIHPEDLATLGLSDKDWVAVASARSRLIVRARTESGLRRGYLVLPHGYGQAYLPAAGGERVICGPRINMLTDRQSRDPIAGTPYHKHVPVRIMQASAPEAAQAEAQSRQIRQTATG
jgi:anaerobic selenocysteine-containing dehydrogenase